MILAFPRHVFMARPVNSRSTRTIAGGVMRRRLGAGQLRSLDYFTYYLSLPDNPVAVIRYLVGDVDAAVAFYTSILGFAVVEKWGPPFAMVRRGDLTLWLSGPGSSASRPLADGSKPVPGGWNRLVLETDDLVSLVEKLRQSGARVSNEIVSGPGGKQILVNDPSGNPVELFESSGG